MIYSGLGKQGSYHRWKIRLGKCINLTSVYDSQSYKIRIRETFVRPRMFIFICQNAKSCWRLFYSLRFMPTFVVFCASRLGESNFLYGQRPQWEPPFVKENANQKNSNTRFRNENLQRLYYASHALVLENVKYAPRFNIIIRRMKNLHQKIWPFSLFGCLLRNILVKRKC